MLDCVVYLYPSVEDAKAGTNFGGSGFLLMWEFEGTGQGLVYVVTNWHVAVQGAPVVRINTKDGKNDIFDFDVADWEFDPRYDIAVHPVHIKQDVHRYSFVPVKGLITRDLAASNKVGPGDDVFMIGRFVDHDGGAKNLPAVRFGNISIDPTPITQPNEARAETYCLDLHSRTGYSGSPVFVFRTPGYDLEHDVSKGNILLAGANLLMLLGIHFAQFPELWEVTEKGKLIREGVKEPLLTDGKFIRGLSGMTCLLPAWSILEVLNMPKIKAHREEVEALTRKQHSAQTDNPNGELFAPPTTDANPAYSEGFSSPLGAAVRPND